MSVVCYDCMKIIDNDNDIYYCRACLDYICADCKSTIPIRICSKCNKIYHLRCTDICVCDECYDCKNCCRC